MRFYRVTSFSKSTLQRHLNRAREKYCVSKLTAKPREQNGAKHRQSCTKSRLQTAAPLLSAAVYI